MNWIGGGPSEDRPHGFVAAVAVATGLRSWNAAEGTSMMPGMTLLWLLAVVALVLLILLLVKKLRT